MPVRVVAQDAPALLSLVLTGSWPTVEEQSELRLQLVKQGQLTRQTAALLDLREVADLPRFSDIDAAMQLAEQQIEGLPKCVALVVLPGATFGVGRMLQSLAPAGVDMELFEDDATARSWLMQR